MPAVTPELLSQLLGGHAPALVLYARQWCRHPEDVVQDAFVQLMKQDQSPRQPVAWLYKVVRNRALNTARSTARRKQHEQAAGQGREHWFEAAEGSLLSAEEAAQALSQLPLESREVIVARLWGGLGFEQIAELVGSSTSTVFRRYQAGLSDLRERMGVACPQTNNPRTG